MAKESHSFMTNAVSQVHMHTSRNDQVPSYQHHQLEYVEEPDSQSEQ